MPYFINKLPQQMIFEHSKSFIDQADITGHVTISNDILSIYLRTYIYQDCVLPSNSFYFNLQLPYQTIENIYLNQVTFYPSLEVWKYKNYQYIDIFEVSYNVDISQNQYFSQKLDNANVPITINYNFDPTSINNVKHKIKKEILDAFSEEVNSLKTNISFKYTNYANITNKSADIEIKYMQWFNLNDSYKIIATYQCNNYLNCQSFIKNFGILDLKIGTEQSILDETSEIIIKKIKFHYWTFLDKTEKILTIDSQDIIKNKDHFDISQNIKTSYDFSKNEVIIDPINGFDGFFIPVESSGYYEIEFVLNTKGINITFLCKNDFSFNKSIPYLSIDVNSIKITSLKDYKEIKF